MSTATLQVVLSTPTGTEVIEGVRHVRLDATDGSRGILPGHEPARVCFVAGPIELTVLEPQPRTEFLATEGGVARIGPGTVVLVCRWAARADSLEALRHHVLERGAARVRAERDARAVARRHELATQRALAGLRREAPG